MQKKLYASLTVAMAIMSISFHIEARKLTDYSQAESWAYLETQVDKPTDVFLVAPTSEFSKQPINVNIHNEKFRKGFKGSLNMERGIYDTSARMFAPYYQQANMQCYYLPDKEGKGYFKFAYRDVKKSFKYYMKHYNQGRPLIVAGFSQGSQHAIQLLKEYLPKKRFRKQFIEGYMIGWRLTEEETKANPYLKPATGAKDLGSLVLLNTEAPDIQDSLMVPRGVKTYGINPLTWETNSKPAAKTANLGACFTDYAGNIKKELPQLTGGYLDSQRGTLKLKDIDPKAYPAIIFPDGIYHIYDYQFFYRNLQQNVALRTAEFLK